MEGKRRKGRLVLSGLLAAFAAVVIGFSWSHREPHYGGKCLSDWLVERQSTEREVALDAIGTKALPWITHWLTATNPEPQWRQKARTFLRQNTRWSWSFLDPIDEQQLGFTGLYALGTNGAPAAPLVARLMISSSQRVQNSAMAALGRIGPRGFESVRTALEEADDEEWPYFAAAVATLHWPDEAAAEVLIKRMATCHSENSKAIGLQSLAIVGRNVAKTIKVLETSLLDESQIVVDGAVMGLCSLGPKARSSVPALLSATNASASGRYSLVRNLRFIVRERRLPFLIPFLHDPDAMVRSGAVSELAAFIPEDPELIPLIVEQLRDPAPDVVAECVAVLKRLHGRRGGPPMESSGAVTAALLSLYLDLTRSNTNGLSDVRLRRITRALQEIDPEIAATIGISSYITDRREGR